jgi:hypothetical protein
MDRPRTGSAQMLGQQAEGFLGQCQQIESKLCLIEWQLHSLKLTAYHP